jgi:hypothetical protein
VLKLSNIFRYELLVPRSWYWLSFCYGGICRYVQSHRIPNDLIDRSVIGRGLMPAPDGLAEAYWPSHEAMLAGMSSELGQRASAALSADEALFCDTARMSAFLAEENLEIGAR